MRITSGSRMLAHMEERAPIVQGEKVWLRGLREGDLGAYERFVSSRDSLWAGYSVPTSAEKVRDWYENTVRPAHGRSAYFFAVCPLGSDEFIGTVWIWNFESRLGGPELSIFMHDPDRWGTGLGTDAIRAALDFVFGFTDTDRVWLASMAENKRAHRSFEKAGFEHEGVIRSYTMHLGKRVDAVLMSILRSDWAAQDRKRSWEL